MNVYNVTRLTGALAAVLALEGVRAAAAAQSCPLPALPGENPSSEQMAELVRLVSRGPIQPEWGARSLPTLLPLTSGCARPTKVPAFIPCEVLHGIAETESNHRQFEAGRTLISHDCGYGLTQVTSGMRGGAGFDPARVAGDTLYNLATGALILGQKWAIRHCVGERQPRTIEHWYRALWAYNGLSYINNPTNPIYSAVRGVWNPKTESRRRPYQELVFGYIEHPPGARWRGVALAYPDPLEMVPSELIASGHPKWPEPHCASPTDCVNERPTHVSACADGPPDAVALVATTNDAPLVGSTATSSSPASSTPTGSSTSAGSSTSTGSSTPPGSSMPAAPTPPAANVVTTASTPSPGAAGSSALGSTALLACATCFALIWVRRARRRC